MPVNQGIRLLSASPVASGALLSSLARITRRGPGFSVFDLTRRATRNLMLRGRSMVAYADTKAGVLVETPVSWAEVDSEAEALGAAHTKTLGTRAFDVLHVAVAIALGTKNFLTFDVRQKSLATKAGIKVRP